MSGRSRGGGGWSKRGLSVWGLSPRGRHELSAIGGGCGVALMLGTEGAGLPEDLLARVQTAASASGRHRQPQCGNGRGDCDPRGLPAGSARSEPQALGLARQHPVGPFGEPSRAAPGLGLLAGDDRQDGVASPSLWAVSTIILAATSAISARILSSWAALAELNQPFGEGRGLVAHVIGHLRGVLRTHASGRTRIEGCGCTGSFSTAAGRAATGRPTLVASSVAATRMRAGRAMPAFSEACRAP